ncbi:MAG: hypothetical protein ABW352_00645 [Polyangiales bacterium]
MKQTKSLLALVTLTTALGCDDGHAGGVPWEGRTQVVQQRDSSSDAEVSRCIEFEGGSCEEARAECASGAVDIALDRNGKLLDVLCYPAAPTWSVEDLAAHEGNIAQRENNTAIVLDGGDQGVDIRGDVSVDANNVVLYGEDPSVAILDGSLTLDGNNALVRGVRITGDVSVLKNDVTLAFCVIEGSLTVSANNLRLLGCEVHGAVNITGNNARLIGNGVAGALTPGKNADCVENRALSDADQDGTYDLGAPLGC